MNLLLLNAAETAARSAKFFYEDWIIVKPFIWLFSQCMNGIMFVLDKVGIYNIALCIVLFTILTKMLLLPMTVKQQKTMRIQSIMNPEIDSEYDTLNAFYCFVSDALSGTYSFSEFCGEFGYDEDSRKAEQTWKACQRSLKKFERVSGYGLDEMYDFINELSEVAA